MGVYCTLRSATPEQIAALVQHPELLPPFFDVVGFEDALPRPTFWQLLRGKAPRPPEVLLDSADSMEVGLDKAWHALHFLFTGNAEGGDTPAAFLLSGGLRIGTEDAHALSPRQVAEFRDYVHGLPEDLLRSRFDPIRMTELQIYPEIIWLRDGTEALDYVMEFHQKLWAFLRDAADERQGCVIWIA